MNDETSLLKEALTIEEVFSLLVKFNANPIMKNDVIIADTICHNLPNEGSKKLYYYNNSKLFQCYTNCDFFDIFDLIIKVYLLQFNQKINIYDAILFIKKEFGLFAAEEEGFTFEKAPLYNQKVIDRYISLQDVRYIPPDIALPAYPKEILDIFEYPRITPWEQDHISKQVIKESRIGYSPSTEQITIPHYDENNRLVGIRGRALIKSEAELYGKYRPLYLGGTSYTHPLSLNLYNLNNSKKNIEKIKTAIIFESEKSTLLYRTYFGADNDISVACCGSNISDYHIKLLLKYKVNTLNIAFDRDFKQIGDQTFLKLKEKLLKIGKKYNKDLNIFFIFDKKMITGYKSSPIDEGREKFMQLYNNRITYVEKKV